MQEQGKNTAREQAFTENSFRGLHLSDIQLPGFVLRVASEIDDAWGDERKKYPGQPETIDSFRRIINKVGKLSARARNAAFEIYVKGEETQREKARKVIYYGAYQTIISRSDFMRRELSRYPEIVVEDNVLIESGLKVIEKIINRVARGDLPISHMLARIGQDIPHEVRNKIFTGREGGIIEELEKKHKEIFRLAALGFNQGKIAEKVGLSRRGVGKIIRRKRGIFVAAE